MKERRELRTIFFILEYFEPYIGGIETLFGALAASLADDNYEVVVYCKKHDAGLESHQRIGRIAVHRISAKTRLGYFRQLVQLSNMKSGKPDLIFTSTFMPSVPSYFLSKIWNAPCILVYHEIWQKLWFDLTDIPMLMRGLYYTYEKIILQLKFECIVAVSQYTYNLLSKYKPEKELCLITNGIDYNKYQSEIHKEPKLIGKETQRKKPFTFLYFGRFGVSKGLPLLLKSFGAMDKKIVKLCCLQLAIPSLSNSENARLDVLIKDSQIKESVNLKIGLNRLDLQESIINADAVVIPSISEGFCFAAVETQALGTPIVSSNRGALQDVVGGKHIKMHQYTQLELTKALEKAWHQEWEESEIKRFKISDSLELYKSLIGNIVSGR